MNRTDEKAPVPGRLFCSSLRRRRSVVSGGPASPGDPENPVDPAIGGDGRPRIGTCRTIVILAVSVAIAAFWGCSSAEPEILQGAMRINAVYDPRTASITEELQIQADLFDPDGLDDIDQLRVLHDGDQLLWTVSGGDLRRHSRRGEEWFSFTASAVPGSTAVPRGAFRIESADLSGREAVREVTIPLTTDRSVAEDFPVLQGGMILLPSGVDELWIVVRPESGEPSVHAVTVEDDAGTAIAVDDLPPPVNEPVSGGAEVWLISEESRYLVRTSGPW